MADSVESFAFHPNGKMAVATCLSKFNNSIAVLDVESDPPRILYNLDAGGGGQGIEFTPEGDKLFVGSSIANRIEVFDVVGDHELRREPEVPEDRLRALQPYAWSDIQRIIAGWV